VPAGDCPSVKELLMMVYIYTQLSHLSGAVQNWVTGVLNNLCWLSFSRLSQDVSGNSSCCKLCASGMVSNKKGS
jgi:hypothetical protein